MNNTPWEIKDRKIKVAVVGCGRIANNHFQALAELHQDIEISAVCDTNKMLLEQCAKEYNAEPYTSLEALLEQASIDLVVLCTPSGLHPRQTIAIAKAGRHIVTEKPMATRWADGLEMIRECDTHGVRLFVVKQNRLNPPIQALKKAIDQKRFGKIYMANVNVFWTRPQDYYNQCAWRGTYELDGGAFMNQASHYVDLIQWLLGPVDAVQAMMATLGRDIEAEDSGVVNVRWRHGAMGSINVTMLTYPKNFEGSITILGEKGTVRVGGVAVNQIQHWDFEDPQPEDEQIRAENYETASVYGFGHLPYYQGVIQSLRGGPCEVADGRSGLKTLELLVAAYRSARDGQTVHLPLEL